MTKCSPLFVSFRPYIVDLPRLEMFGICNFADFLELFDLAHFSISFSPLEKNRQRYPAFLRLSFFFPSLLYIARLENARLDICNQETNKTQKKIDILIMRCYFCIVLQSVYLRKNFIVTHSQSDYTTIFLWHKNEYELRTCLKVIILFSSFSRLN